MKLQDKLKISEYYVLYHPDKGFFHDIRGDLTIETSKTMNNRVYRRKNMGSLQDSFCKSPHLKDFRIMKVSETISKIYTFTEKEESVPIPRSVRDEWM